ncbi:hypothetical protein K505DRAFT_396136 [Melanomma pulvis-pyrius CBS 109.77]|uniref:Uncharacterized protein n=1 Tax=Melanomma pulvis-pyrius CBS 109.77 TaxID=1314802 RepID=A0A6A6WUB1_9PLEO|nr:hypothetical protein K505DRAFT_396136 [Melanomma pulvis-pyrius CBS 109.77]
MAGAMAERFSLSLSAARRPLGLSVPSGIDIRAPRSTTGLATATGRNALAEGLGGFAFVSHANAARAAGWRSQNVSVRRRPGGMDNAPASSSAASPRGLQGRRLRANSVAGCMRPMQDRLFTVMAGGVAGTAGDCWGLLVAAGDCWWLLGTAGGCCHGMERRWRIPRSATARHPQPNGAGNISRAAHGACADDVKRVASSWTGAPTLVAQPYHSTLPRAAQALDGLDSRASPGPDDYNTCPPTVPVHASSLPHPQPHAFKLAYLPSCIIGDPAGYSTAPVTMALQPVSLASRTQARPVAVVHHECECDPVDPSAASQWPVHAHDSSRRLSDVRP